MKIAPILALALAGSGSACSKSKTPKAVMDEEVPKIRALRTKLLAITDAAKTAKAGGDCNVPGLTYDRKHGGTLEIMAYERIVEPVLAADKRETISLLYSPGCETALYWSYAGGDLSGGDADGMSKTFKACRAATHVLVVRQGPHDRAKGDLTLSYYLASIEDGTIDCAFGGVSHADPTLGVQNYKTVETNLETGVKRDIDYSSRDEYASAQLSAVNDAVKREVQDRLHLTISTSTF